MLGVVRRPLISLLIVVGMLMTACGSADQNAADGTADSGATAASPSTPADDDGMSSAEPSTPEAAQESSTQAPFGMVETVGGTVVNGADYAGSNLALWFWAPW